jgi:hypothetical protein
MKFVIPSAARDLYDRRRVTAFGGWYYFFNQPGARRQLLRRAEQGRPADRHGLGGGRLFVGDWVAWQLVYPPTKGQ